MFSTDGGIFSIIFFVFFYIILISIPILSIYSIFRIVKKFVLKEKMMMKF